MKVTLSTGIEIEVYAPPIWKLYDLAEKRHPRPEPPIRVDKTVTGGEISMRIEDDPGYLAALEERDTLVAETVNELNMLFALKDVEPPDDFDMEADGDLFRYVDPNWAPREGKVGRKLDYIEHVLLCAPVDLALVQEIINGMTLINQEEIAAIANSFRH